MEASLYKLNHNTIVTLFLQTKCYAQLLERITINFQIYRTPKVISHLEIMHIKIFSEKVFFLNVLHLLIELIFNDSQYIRPYPR